MKKEVAGNFRCKTLQTSCNLQSQKDSLLLIIQSQIHQNLDETIGGKFLHFHY